MKLITKEEADAHQAAVVSGGLKGFATGVAIAVPTFTTAYLKTSYYRTLPLSLKAFGAVIIVIPLTIINAERSGEAFERAQWTGAGEKVLEQDRARASRKYEGLTEQQKWKAWAIDHQYSLVGSAWAASVAGSFAYVWRQPGLTTVNKLIQARIIAQALTVGLIVSAVVLTQVDPDHPAKKEPDHTWAAILEQTEKEKHEGHPHDVAKSQLLSAHEKFRDGQKGAGKVVV